MRFFIGRHFCLNIDAFAGSRKRLSKRLTTDKALQCGVFDIEAGENGSQRIVDSNHCCVRGNDARHGDHVDLLIN